MFEKFQAKEKTCIKCRKLNHLREVWRSSLKRDKPERQVHQFDSEDTDRTLMSRNVIKVTQQPRFSLKDTYQ